MGPKDHTQRRGPHGPQRLMSANGRQKGAAHPHAAQRPRWNHQVVDLSQLFKSDPRGPPEASDGPSPMCKAYTYRNDQHGQAVSRGLLVRQQFAWLTHKMRFTQLRCGRWDHGNSTWAARRARRRLGLHGPQRVMLGNSHQSDAAHVHVAQWSQ